MHGFIIAPPSVLNTHLGRDKMKQGTRPNAHLERLEELALDVAEDLFEGHAARGGPILRMPRAGGSRAPHVTGESEGRAAKTAAMPRGPGTLFGVGGPANVAVEIAVAVAVGRGALRAREDVEFGLQDCQLLQGARQKEKEGTGLAGARSTGGEAIHFGRGVCCPIAHWQTVPNVTMAGVDVSQSPLPASGSHYPSGCLLSKSHIGG